MNTSRLSAETRSGKIARKVRVFTMLLEMCAEAEDGGDGSHPAELHRPLVQLS